MIIGIAEYIYIKINKAKLTYAIYLLNEEMRQLFLTVKHRTKKLNFIIDEYNGEATTA